MAGASRPPDPHLRSPPSRRSGKGAGGMGTVSEVVFGALILQAYLCEGVGHPGITLRAGPESSLYWVFLGVFARGRPRAATGKHPQKHPIKARFRPRAQRDARMAYSLAQVGLQY